MTKKGHQKWMDLNINCWGKSWKSFSKTISEKREKTENTKLTKEVHCMNISTMNITVYIGPRAGKNLRFFKKVFRFLGFLGFLGF